MTANLLDEAPIVKVAGRTVTLLRPEDDDKAEVVVAAWVEEARAGCGDDGLVVMGLDCEWQPPWFRTGQEKVGGLGRKGGRACTNEPSP